MNRGEAIAILLGVAVTVAFVLWLALSAIWAKRKVPARLGSFVIDESHVHLLEPGENLLERWATPRPVKFEWVEDAFLTPGRVFDGSTARFCAFDFRVQGPLPFDWARDLHTPDWSRRRV